MKGPADDDGHDVADYEIIYEDSDPSASVWRKIWRGVAPVIGFGQAVLGDAYANAARATLERKESLEDFQAERQAKRRLAVRARRQG
jgi:hypothetical protein